MKAEIREGTKKTALVEVSGELDASTAPQFEETSSKALAEATNLALNFSGVTFISSAGLRILLRLRRDAGEKGGEVRLFGLSKMVAGVFKMAGLDTIFPIHTSAEEALKEG